MRPRRNFIKFCFMPLISNIFHCKSKNRILFYLLFFIISSFSLTAQDFQLASNNKTITCDNASIGDTGSVGGKTYTKVNRSTLVSMISGGQDVSCVCTSRPSKRDGKAHLMQATEWLSIGTAHAVDVVFKCTRDNSYGYSRPRGICKDVALS